MVSTKPYVPNVILERRADEFLEQAQLSPVAERRIRQASGDEQFRLMARAWFSRFHGSTSESKKMFVLLMREEDIPFTGEDIQAITDDPPVDTQT